MRLFTAILLSEEIRERLVELTEAIRLQSSGGNFTDRRNLHLTLAFIGETENIQAACRALDAADFPRFELTLEGVGRFKRNGGDIVWAGVGKTPQLLSLQQSLSEELTRAGFRLESRAYTPHLTLGREVRLKEGARFSDFEKILSRMAMEVPKISLMKSERQAGRLVYTEIYQKDLK